MISKRECTVFYMLLLLIGTEITRDEASACLSKAYWKFYFRPGIILRRALRAQPFGEFKRAVGILKNSLSRKGRA